jgi:hypothetical protein
VLPRAQPVLALLPIQVFASCDVAYVGQAGSLRPIVNRPGVRSLPSRVTSRLPNPGAFQPLRFRFARMWRTDSSVPRPDSPCRPANAQAVSRETDPYPHLLFHVKHGSDTLTYHLRPPAPTLKPVPPQIWLRIVMLAHPHSSHASAPTPNLASFRPRTPPPTQNPHPPPKKPSPRPSVC